MSGAKTAVVAILAVLLLGGGVLLLTGGDDDTNTVNNQTNTSETTEQRDDTQTPEVSEEVDRVIEVDMSNFEFSTENIQLSPGETVKIVATSTGGSHNFVIDEFNFQTATASAGETVEGTFTVPEDFNGTVAFYCSIGNHRALGMEGEIVVSGL